MSRVCLSLTVFLLVAALATPLSNAQVPAKTDGSTELEDMKADLKQMRIILNQMANNLAFVSDSQNPLKHQFQLDIEMWQVVMMRMQQRINRLEGKPAMTPLQPDDVKK